MAWLFIFIVSFLYYCKLYLFTVIYFFLQLFNFRIFTIIYFFAIIYHRLVLSLSVVVQPFPGGLWNRSWLPHRPTTLRELLCMRLHENVFGCNEWSITSRSHVVWTSPTPPPLSMKIMWLVLHRCAWVMSRAISQSILLQNSFPISSRRAGR